MKRTAVILGAAMALSVATALAQGRNFTGKWTIDTQKTAAPVASGGIPIRTGADGPAMSSGPAPTTILLEGTSFTVGMTTYKIDGTITIDAQGRTITAKAAWKGDKLVIEETVPGPAGNVVTTVSWYLDGQHLVRERSTPSPTGGEPRVTKTYLKRM